VIPGGLRIEHTRPGDEPLLWAADIVAGAISAAEGLDATYRELISGLLTEHRLQLS
jgi:hypothetical protein